MKYPSCDLYCARHLEDTFKRVVANEEVAAVIAEPVLGEGGFVAPPPDYFKVLIDLCHKHGVLFIADEVQSGFGRTGAMFASERYGIEPDILVTAKSLGGGLPLAAITGRAEIMDAPASGGLGGTFAGNPLSCAAALAVLDLFETESLLARANELGDRFQRRAREWQRRWPIVGDVRGLGGMQAIELVKSQETKTSGCGRNQADHAVLLRARPDHHHRRFVLQRDPHPRPAGRNQRANGRGPRRAGIRVGGSLRQERCSGTVGVTEFVILS